MNENWTVQKTNDIFQEISFVLNTKWEEFSMEWNNLQTEKAKKIIKNKIDLKN
jgi:hypothetical protein